MVKNSVDANTPARKDGITPDYEYRFSACRLWRQVPNHPGVPGSMLLVISGRLRGFRFERQNHTHAYSVFALMACLHMEITGRTDIADHYCGTAGPQAAEIAEEWVE